MCGSVATSSQPKQNSNGHLVWNPQVGLYAKAYDNQRESYGGVIGAIQDKQVQFGGTVRSYPHNFAGIISAIQDLVVTTSGPPVLPGPTPGNGSINPDTGEWNPALPIPEGSLWFDTRQGRLFCYIDSQWIQTNGADGLAQITNTGNPPALESTPAPGQFWYDNPSNNLYIHNGIYVDEDGNPVSNDTPGATPLWRLVNTDPGTFASNLTSSAIPLSESPTDVQLNTQQDYNTWTYDKLALLENAIEEKSDVVISPSAPAAPYEGLLWYDSERLDLSVYYIDSDGDSQWVPVSAPATYDTEFADLRTDIETESQNRTAAVVNLQQAINDLDAASNTTVQGIQDKVSAVEQAVEAITSIEYVTKAEAAADNDALQNQITSIVIPSPPDLSPYVTNSALDELKNQVNALPTGERLEEIRALIPDVAAFVTQTDINTSVNNITNNFLPKGGGILTGSFVFNKVNYDQPALDFSLTPTTSKEAFKFQSLAPTPNNFSSFGSTSSFWEQAWQFAADEDFCWIYNNSNKVFSITKEGPACTQLYLGDFGTNTSNGRVIRNKIDVRERLTTYQTALQQVRQAVSSATDFDSLKSGLLTALANV